MSPPARVASSSATRASSSASLRRACASTSRCTSNSSRVTRSSLPKAEAEHGLGVLPDVADGLLAASSDRRAPISSRMRGCAHDGVDSGLQRRRSPARSTIRHTGSARTGIGTPRAGAAGSAWIATSASLRSPLAARGQANVLAGRDASRDLAPRTAHHRSHTTQDAPYWCSTPRNRAPSPLAAPQQKRSSDKQNLLITRLSRALARPMLRESRRELKPFVRR